MQSGPDNARSRRQIDVPSPSLPSYPVSSGLVDETEFLALYQFVLAGAVNGLGKTSYSLFGASKKSSFKKSFNDQVPILVCFRRNKKGWKRTPVHVGEVVEA